MGCRVERCKASVVRHTLYPKPYTLSFQRVDAEPQKQRAKPAERQSDHIGKASLDPLNEGLGSSLDRVPPSLIERLTGPDIGIDLGIRQGSHSHLGYLVSDLSSGIAGLHDSKPRYDLMASTAQPLQKPASFIAIFRFTQQATVTFDNSIRA